MSEVPPGLIERALAKLGFDAEPGIDRRGLDALYAAWCLQVPFDNVRKRIAMLEGVSGPLPGGLPADFLSAWLEHGTGGTCWPSSNGLHALVRACGFDVRRISASMFDRNDHNHGSLVVRLAGEELMVDSSIQCGAPIALRRGLETRHDDPVHPIRVEPLGAGFLIHWGMAQSQATMPCRLMDDPVDEAFFLSRYEISRGYSVFNNALYARRNFPDRLVSYVGNTRHEKSESGVTSRELAPGELERALVDELGLSEAIVARLRACGGLEPK
jgi:N-hydroxyarylamine O-acetyltransferase